MKKLPLRTLFASLPAIAALLLVVACGDDSTGDNGNGGSGGVSSAGTGPSSGSGNKAGANGTGGSNGSGSGGFSTGISGTKPLSDLTADEIEQLCDDLDAFYTNSSVSSDLQELTCRFASLLGAAFAGAETDEEAQTACQMAYDSCQAKPIESTRECGPPSGECTATVAELTACTNDSAEGLNEAREQFPDCSELTLDDLEAEPVEEDTQPTSCKTLEMKCPGGPTLPIPTM